MTNSGSQQPRMRDGTINLPVRISIPVLALFVLAILAVGYFTFDGVRKLVVNVPWGSGAADTPQFGSGADIGQLDVQGDSVPVWSEGRVNVLLLGIDERQLEEGPWRTDTMILLTMDPAAQTAGMLSIPRDLWVEIPGYGVRDRINTAHFRGDADRYPGGGGPALAMDTVQANLGVPVNYYVTVNFYAFVQIIDRIGCIPLTVPQTIDDPDFPAPEGYGYSPFHIDAGDYCLGGETLLQYARTRATYGSDFDRAARQQQVIRAIRSHVLSTGELPTLIAQAPTIYGDVQQGVNTNLTIQQIIQLARVAAEIPDENFCSAVIDGQYVNPMTAEDGSQVLVPDWTKVRGLVSDLYNGTGQCDPNAEAVETDFRAEEATVKVVNGTREEGLATQTADRLMAAGINVVEVGNADQTDYEETVIYNYTGKDLTAQAIAETLSLPASAIIASEPPNGGADIEVILGTDAAP
jgi:LCP family protein required for cell wall assembly